MTFENEVRKGQIEIIKVDKENKEVKLEGVTFEILDSNNNVVDTIVTDSEGKATSKRLSIYDEYKICEKETRKEYILTDDIQKVVLEENEIKSITFENQMKKGTIKILKISNGHNELLGIPDGSPLAGAKFSVKNSNGEEIGIYETNEKGEILIEKMPYGEYCITEVEAPESFEINTESQTAFISEDGQIVELTFKNNAKLPKTGNDINYLPIIVISSLVVAFFSIKILLNKDEREEIKYE